MTLRAVPDPPKDDLDTPADLDNLEIEEEQPYAQKGLDDVLSAIRDGFPSEPLEGQEELIAQVYSLSVDIALDTVGHVMSTSRGSSMSDILEAAEDRLGVAQED